MKKLVGVLAVVVLVGGVWLLLKQKDVNITDATVKTDNALDAGGDGALEESDSSQVVPNMGTIWKATLDEMVVALESEETDPDDTHQRLNESESTEDLPPEINATLEGYVVDAVTGEPVTDFEFGEIRGAYSYMVKSAASTRSFQRAQNAEGRFVVENISRSFTFILVRAMNYEPYFIQVGNIQPEEHFTQVEVRLDPAPGVFGSVIDDAGGPVEGAVIVLGAVFHQNDGAIDRAEAYSDVNGEFQLDFAPTGARVSAYKNGYSVGSGVITDDGDGGRSVNITLNSGGVVEGVVTRAGVAQVGERVRMKQSNFTWVEMGTDERGHYRFSEVPAGDAEVNAMGLVRQTSVEVGQVVVVDFESATDTGTVEGKVTSGGKALSQAGVTVIARGGGMTRITRAHVEVDGSYRALDIPVGPCTVKIAAGGDGSLSSAMKFFDVEVRGGAVTRVDADFTGGASLSGVVSGSRYYAVDSAVLFPGEIEFPDPMTLNFYRELEQIVVGNLNLDAGGEFVFEGLEPGVYTIVGCSFLEESPEAFASAYVGVEVVELTGDQETVLEIVME